MFPKKGCVLSPSGHERWQMKGDNARLNISRQETWTMHMYLPRKSSWSGSLSYTSTSNSWPGTSWTMTWCTRHIQGHEDLTICMEASRGPHLAMNENELYCNSLDLQIQNRVKWFMIWVFKHLYTWSNDDTNFKHFIKLLLPHTSLPTWENVYCQYVWRWRSEGQPSVWHRGQTSQP